MRLCIWWSPWLSCWNGSHPRSLWHIHTCLLEWGQFVVYCFFAGRNNIGSCFGLFLGYLIYLSLTLWLTRLLSGTAINSMQLANVSPECQQPKDLMREYSIKAGHSLSHSLLNCSSICSYDCEVYGKYLRTQLIAKKWQMRPVTLVITIQLSDLLSTPFIDIVLQV